MSCQWCGQQLVVSIGGNADHPGTQLGWAGLPDVDWALSPMVGLDPPRPFLCSWGVLHPGL